MTKKLLFLVTALALGNIVAAQAPSLIEGYGETQWGQSLEEVQEILPGGKTTGKDSARTAYTVQGDGPVAEIHYLFVGDQLFEVDVLFDLPGRPEESVDKEGVSILKEKVNDKYYKTAESKKMLKDAGIQIRAEAYIDRKVMVTYTNAIVYKAGGEAWKKAQRAKQGERKLRRAERFKEFTEAGADDAL